MTAIMPSIIRSPSSLFNISTIVVVHSYEISKILLCQEEQLTLKYYLLNDKLISPYTIVCNTSYTSITLQTVPQRLSHSVNFNDKNTKKKNKKTHTLFFQTPFNWLPLPYLGRVSLPSLLPRTEASFSNFAAGPSNEPREQREGERGREERRKKN